MSRPLLGVSAFLALGALVGQSVAPPAACGLLCLASGLLVLALAAPRARAAAPSLAGAALAIGAAGAGVERVSYERTPLAVWVQSGAGDESPVRLRGTAAEDARQSEDRWILVLDLDGLTLHGRELAVPGRVRVLVAGEAGRLEVGEGDRVAVWAQLRGPRGFGNPGAFDVLAQARRQGIHAWGSCKSPLLVEVAGSGDVGFVRAAAARTRRWARGVLRASMPQGTEAGLVRAMVLGDRASVDPETAETFRMAGTYHVLALSGAQVAVLAAILLWALRGLGLGPVSTAVLVSSGLVFYAELVGADVPVTRAVVMAIVMLLGRALDLDSDAANLLGLAAGLLLVARPGSIGDVGFQLSFTATLGIVLLTPRLLPLLPRLPLGASAALAASFAAQAALAPLLLFHFHRLAPAALLLNLAAVPLSGAVMVLGLLVLVAAAVAPMLAPLLGDAAWIAAHALVRSGEAARLFPGLDARFATPVAWAIALYVTALVLAVLPGRLRAGMLLLPAGLVALLVGHRPGHGDGRLHLTVLDVGQGDALVVRSPHGRVWLVDAGGGQIGRFDLGEAVVAPYLWSQGIRRVDGIVVTHAHPDHVGGIPFLLRNFRVGHVWEGLAPRRDAVYQALDGELRASRPVRTSVARGAHAEWDGVSVDVLGPRPGAGPPWRARNDDSVVLLLGWGKVRFLLTGDIESRGERGLGEASARVVKVPHHGSRTSSGPAFVSGTGPLVAVVSVGFRNNYGHPHPEILARYAGVGAQLYRTDRDGAVTVSTDGNEIWVNRFRQ